MSNTKELNISSSAWLTYGVGVFPFGFVLFLIATPVIRFSPQVRAATDDLDGQGPLPVRRLLNSSVGFLPSYVAC
jgi:hypothetical protein